MVPSMHAAFSETHGLSLLLLAHETAVALAATDDRAALLRVLDRLRPHLALLLGLEGYRSLVARALFLAQADCLVLRLLRVEENATLTPLPRDHPPLNEQEASHFLNRLLDLLCAFIGPKITLQLLMTLWPDIAFKESQPEGGNCQDDR